MFGSSTMGCDGICGGALAGLFLVCLAYPILDIGLPLLMTGIVRLSVGKPRKLRRLRNAGIVITVIGFGMAIVGGVMMGVGQDPRVRIAGLFFIPSFGSLGLFAGLPLWIDAWRMEKLGPKRSPPRSAHAQGLPAVAQPSEHVRLQRLRLEPSGRGAYLWRWTVQF